MFKNICFLTLVNYFFLNYCFHAVCLIGFFSDVCFECQFVVKPDTQVFFELHFFNVFAIDFIKPLPIHFLGSYCHVNTFVDIKGQKTLA